MDPLLISRTGMDVEWQRMGVIADNLANMGTTRTALGQPYQPVRLVSGPRIGFDQHLEPTALGGVQVYGLEATGHPPRRVHDPHHPHADSEGFVSYPGVDHTAEMVLLVQSARFYEANVIAFNTGRQMYAKALEIGRR